MGADHHVSLVGSSDVVFVDTLVIFNPLAVVNEHVAAHAVLAYLEQVHGPVFFANAFLDGATASRRAVVRHLRIAAEAAAEGAHSFALGSLF